MRDVLVHVTTKDEVCSPSKKVGYLEALVRLLQTRDVTADDDDDTELGLRMKEVMTCLRLPLASSSEDVRSAGMKTVRYLVKSKQDATAAIQVG